MNVQIRRLGIVIKTIPVKGDKARIGSGEECEISLSDPYLASVVAELIRRDGEWYIVDVGSSLDGVRHGDVKITEELFDPGEAFVIGGFEIVREGTPVARATQSRTLSPESIPATMFQAKLDPLPGTVIQSLDEMRGARPERVDDSKSRLAFQKLPTSPGPKEQPGPARPKSRIRLILLAAAVMFGLLFLAVIIGSGSGKKAPATPPADTAAAVPTTAPAAPAPAPVATGDAAALRLDLPNAFAGWEADLERKDDPVLRRKLVSGALEVGRAYAAAGDPRAADYLEIVIRNGAAGSTEVAIARERLDFIRK